MPQCNSVISTVAYSAILFLPRSPLAIVPELYIYIMLQHSMQYAD